MATATKPKRKALKDLSLPELYARDKITDAVFKHIITKEDFSRVSPSYCESACKLPCHMKQPSRVNLQHGQVDIMIIQDAMPLDDKWKSSWDLYQLHLRQIVYMANATFRGMSTRVHSLLKCKPERWVEGRKEKKLTYTNMSRCAPYLWEEILRAKPKVIISTSTEVSKALGVKKSNYKNRGEFDKTALAYLGEDIPVVLTLHPKVLNMIRQNASGAMYGPDYLSVIRRDFAKASAIAHGEIKLQDIREVVRRVAEEQIDVCRSIDDVRAWCDLLLKLPPHMVLSWDLETTSLDAWSEDARILLCQFGYRRADGKVQAIVIPLWHCRNKFYDPDEAWEFVAKVLKARHPKVGHNVKFDSVFCRVTTGVEPENVQFDTMLILHSINSGIQGNYSLKTAVWDWLPQSGLGGYEDLLFEALPDDYDPKVGRIYND